MDSEARSEIQSALQRGYEVTVHETPLNVNGWEGSGYAIIDPENGIGAYKISGGVSGGIVNLPDGLWIVEWLTSILEKVSEVPFLKSIAGVFGKLLEVLGGV